MRSLLLSSLAALALTTTLASPASSPVPNDPCTKSFYTAGNSILKICNTDVTKGTAYVIMQIFKQNPSYVQAQCASYCPSTGGSQTTPSTFNPSDQCKAAVQTAIGDVGAKCGTPANEQATAERLFRQTDARFIAAQCAPYCPTAVSSIRHRLSLATELEDCSHPRQRLSTALRESSTTPIQDNAGSS